MAKILLSTLQLPPGPVGPPANLQIGTVETVPAGSAASATISGTAPDYTMDLELPEGPAAPEVAPTDEFIAGRINTPGSATQTALNTTIVGVVGPAVANASPLFGGAYVSAGDSIDQGDSSNSPTAPVFGNTWHSALCDLSDGRLFYLRNAAVAGRTSGQVLAGLDAEVIALAPDVVGVKVGTNDAGTGVTFATTVANIKAIVAKLRAASIKFFLAEIPPRGMAALGAPAPPTLTQAATGGSLGAGTYAYSIVGKNDVGTTVASAEASIVVASGTTNAITVLAPARDDVHEWRFYGRTPGAQGLLATQTNTPGIPSRAIVDTGAATPGVTAPSSDTTGQAPTAGERLATARINAWLREYCATERIPLIPLYDVSIDPDTGYWITGSAWGALHPTPTTQYAMGRRASEVLLPLLRPQPSIGAKDALDPTNLHSNPFFLAGASNTPTGWAYGNAQTRVLAPRAGFKGQAWGFGLSAWQSPYATANGPDVTTGFAAGDMLEVSLRFEAKLAEGAAEAQIQFRRNGSAVRARLLAGIDTDPHLWVTRYVVPDATTALDFQILFGRGTGMLYIGELTVRNLSQLAEG